MSRVVVKKITAELVKDTSGTSKNCCVMPLAYHMLLESAHKKKKERMTSGSTIARVEERKVDKTKARTLVLVLPLSYYPVMIDEANKYNKRITDQKKKDDLPGTKKRSLPTGGKKVNGGAPKRQKTKE